LEQTGFLTLNEDVMPMHALSTGHVTGTGVLPDVLLTLFIMISIFNEPCLLLYFVII